MRRNFSRTGKARLDGLIELFYLALPSCCEKFTAETRSAQRGFLFMLISSFDFLPVLRPPRLVSRKPQDLLFFLESRLRKSMAGRLTAERRIQDV
jgi:hypothetical protein